METDLEIEVVVRVHTYGNPDKLALEIPLRVAREIGHAMDPNVDVSLHAIAKVEDHPVRRILSRVSFPLKWYRWDKFGDDSGHHPGHDVPLVPLKP